MIDYEKEIENINTHIDDLCKIRMCVKYKKTKKAIGKVILCLLDYKIMLCKIKFGVKPYANIE